MEPLHVAMAIALSRGQLLERAGVAVGVLKGDERAAGLLVEVAGGDAAGAELVAVGVGDLDHRVAVHGAGGPSG